MLQRRTHARSKDGCSTWKKRHVRCDERRPYWRVYQSTTFSPKAAHIPSLASILNASLTHQQSKLRKAWPRVQIPTSSLRDLYFHHRAATRYMHHPTLTVLISIHYGAPHFWKISPEAIHIVEEAYLSRARPMPRSFWATVTNDFAPKYVRPSRDTTER